jgi:hypothetical protein
MGRAGTSCAGLSFETSVISGTAGMVRFTPQPEGTAQVTLPGSGSTCVIDFTFDVLKTPTGDADPAKPGIQTFATTHHSQYTAGDTDIVQARGTTTTTVQRAGSSVIQTQASPNVGLGPGQGALSDSAFVTGRVNPVAGATIDFRLYGPDDETCSGVPTFQSLGVPYPAGGGTVSSAQYTPVQGGTYRWIATYSGDANNLPITAPCNAPNETVLVFRARIDIDGDTKYDALTDGLLIIRYLFGLTGVTLTNNAISATATRKSPDIIKAYLDNIRPSLDVDGNGQVNALTDGLLLLRYLFGLRGPALGVSAVTSGAPRSTAAQVEAYIQTLTPP